MAAPIKKILLISASLITLAASAFAQNKDYPIQPVSFTQVHVHDNFWEPKMEVNANVTIPYTLQQCRLNGR